MSFYLSWGSEGFMLSTSGVGMIIVQLWIFPALQRKLGALKVFQLTLWLFTITSICPPLVTWVARCESVLPDTSSYALFFLETRLQETIFLMVYRFLALFFCLAPGNKTSSTVAYMSAVLMLRSPTTMCYGRLFWIDGQHQSDTMR
jgi:hypothetical protein